MLWLLSLLRLRLLVPLSPETETPNPPAVGREGGATGGGGTLRGGVFGLRGGMLLVPEMERLLGY